MPDFVRFAFVGATGLLSDTAMFSSLVAIGMHPFEARIFSLAFATLVTWTLNRRLTFDSQERQVGEEMSRYILVTLVAQGFSYAVFVSMLTVFPHVMHQISLVLGAGCGAVLSYTGHKFVSFGPVPKEIKTRG